MAAPQTVGQRFSQLIQALGMSKNAFALSLDKTATVIQHIVEERNKPGFDLLCKVFEVYPNVSKDWLMQGTGSMFPFHVDVAAETLGSASIAEAAPVAPPAATAALAPQSEEVPAVATEPVPAAFAVPQTEPVAPPSVPVAQTPVAQTPSVAPAASSPNWEAMLYAQQLQHQLALAEQRNQHLLEQQKMMFEQQRIMQQMMEMLRPAR